MYIDLILIALVKKTSEIFSMRKVLILSEYVSGVENSTGYYWSEIIRSLANNFGNVGVICPTQTSNDIEGPSSISYYFIGRQRFSDKNIFLRILGQVMKSLRFSLRLLMQAKKGDVVICGTNPALFVLLMPVLKKAKGVVWLLVAHDVFPENLVPANIMSNGNVLYSILSAYYNWVYKCADKVVVIGRDMQSLVNKKIFPSTCTELIPNWASPNEVAALPKEKALFIQDLGWQKKIVFQFFGNMGRVQGINNILSAIANVTHPRAAFLFIGDGVMVPAIKSFIAENPKHSVAYFAPTPIDKRERALAACDVAIVTLAPGMLGLGVPSKSYFSLAADKPLLVVSDCGSEIGMVVEEENVGWWCKPDDPYALASMIDHICSVDLLTYVGRPRKVLVEKYSDTIALRKYNAVVNELLAG